LKQLYRQKVYEARQKGFNITLLFFWLQSVELAKERVKIRVTEGGHNIEPDVIERRYLRGIKNLFNIYLPIVDGALIFDNSFGKHILIAKQMIGNDLEIIDSSKFTLLKKYHDND
jgi:predicted ABC-type ATPase